MVLAVFSVTFAGILGQISSKISDFTPRAFPTKFPKLPVETLARFPGKTPTIKSMRTLGRICSETFRKKTSAEFPAKLSP